MKNSWAEVAVDVHWSEVYSATEGTTSIAPLIHASLHVLPQYLKSCFNSISEFAISEFAFFKFVMISEHCFPCPCPAYLQ